MKIIRSIIFSALLVCGQSHADAINQNTAAHFIATFYQALQNHNLATVSSMIDDHAVIKVVWTQADPPQTFTLNKADYLQQLKATWHFASDDHYEIKKTATSMVDGVPVVTLQASESRTLFGSKVGQRNDLKITLGGSNSNPRIITMLGRMEMNHVQH